MGFKNQPAPGIDQCDVLSEERLEALFQKLKSLKFTPSGYPIVTSKISPYPTYPGWV